MTLRPLLLICISLGLFGLNSCKKESNSPSEDQNGQDGMNGVSIMQMEQGPADCGCPENLIFFKNSKGKEGVEKKLVTSFSGDNIPELVGVRGTEDFQAVELNEDSVYKWKSGNKYSSPEQILELYKNGVLINECSYNANGVLNPCASDSSGSGDGDGSGSNPVVQIQNFQLVLISGGVSASWSSLIEESADYYILDRMITGGAFEPVTAISATGSGSTYVCEDIVDPGTYTYRVRAVLFDGTETSFPGLTITVN